MVSVCSLTALIAFSFQTWQIFNSTLCLTISITHRFDCICLQPPALEGRLAKKQKQFGIRNFFVANA